MLTRQSPVSARDLDASGWGIAWPEPDHGPWSTELRGGVETGSAGWAQGRVGLVARTWAAQWEREPASFAPRSTEVELDLGIVWHPGERFRTRRDLHPLVRSVVTWNAGPGLAWLHIPGQGDSASPLLPLGMGLGVDTGARRTAVRLLIRGQVPLVLPSQSATVQTVTGDYLWSWSPGRPELSLVVGVVRRRVAPLPRPEPKDRGALRESPEPTHPIAQPNYRLPSVPPPQPGGAAPSATAVPVVSRESGESGESGESAIQLEWEESPAGAGSEAAESGS